MIIQLKASDSFLKMVSSFKRADAIVLCEGYMDAEVFKTIASRLGFTEKFKDKGIAVTDAEGLNTLRRNILPATLALVKVVDKARAVALLVDADDVKPEEKIARLRDGLEARNFKASIPEPTCSSVWRLNIPRDGRKVPVLVAVNGLFNYPFNVFKTHELEDHIVYLKLVERRLTVEEVGRAERAGLLVARDDYTTLLNTASREHLEEAFKHIACMLRALEALINPETLR